MENLHNMEIIFTEQMQAPLMTNFPFDVLFLDWDYICTQTAYNIIELPEQPTYDFLGQLPEPVTNFKNLENLTTIYHYSIPNVKLMYPEPFIASASFMHSDLWFMHILIYQYWLWFVFIFIIVFFFLTFVTIVRWCNMRTRPRRETRGVSRSKCGDLITACVPVSWATSIIVNESTDAIDLYDGFGTTELVIGIRAYQWGWEYYYPKDLDLNYAIKQNYSTFIGNSIKYNRTTATNTQTTNFFKFYQNKQFDFSVIPATFIFFNLDNLKLFNFFNFKDFGLSSFNESTVFKKASTFFKSNKLPLFSSYNKYDNLYLNLTKTFLNDHVFTLSHAYALRPQNTFLTQYATPSNLSTFLDNTSFKKLLHFNFFFDTLKVNLQTPWASTWITQINTPYELYLNNFFSHYSNIIDIWFFKNILFSEKNLYLLNYNSDRKQLQIPLLKLFNTNLLNPQKLTQPLSKPNMFSNNEISNLQTQLPLKSTLTTKRLLFAPTENVLFSQRYPRNFLKTSAKQFNYQLSFYPNALLNNLQIMKQNNALTNFSSFTQQKFLFFDQNTFAKLASQRLLLLTPTMPISSSKLTTSLLNFDAQPQPLNMPTPFILQHREDSILNSFKTAYWSLYFSNPNPLFRISNNLYFHTLNSNFYLPNTSLIATYDFKNIQTLTLFENAFWESAYPLAFFEIYAFLNTNFFTNFFTNKYLIYFNAKNREFRYLDKLIYNLDLQENQLFDFTYSNFFFTDNTFLNPTLANRHAFASYAPLILFFDIDDTYDYFKAITNLNSLMTFLPTTNFAFNYLSFFTLANTFRSNINFWFWLNTNNAFSPNTAIISTFLFTKLDTLPKIFYTELAKFQTFTWIANLTQTHRETSFLNLRNTTKNLLINYNSLQKVFKARLDENRSFAKFQTLTNSSTNQNNLSMGKPAFETFLGKNKTNFFKINFFKTNFFANFNSLANLEALNNYYIFTFPFLLSLKSDASKHIWLDWFSRWNFCEIQPSSSSKYAIHGMPYFNKPFNFSSTHATLLNESEQYLTRLTLARKNYLPNFAYTASLFHKTNTWYKTNFFSETLTTMVSDIQTLKKNLLLTSLHWKTTNSNHRSFNLNAISFIPTNSNINSFGKTSWQPLNSSQSYYYNTSALFDILTKREYIYRQFLLNQNYVALLPLALTTHANNPLVREFKNLFNNINLVTKTTEFSKASTYYALTSFWLLQTENFFFNTFFKQKFYQFLNTYFFFAPSAKQNINTLNNYKDQYRPLKKGITNMIKLHATGAIAMPIEIRLQILASSKDVIHSWAVPSAGIKIDCVPGYSSHKVMIFLTSGIFWGQCMEICGRYHHWMPIVVYFMKRDLFFLWCTHFVFLNANELIMNDRQTMALSRTVSIDKSAWITDFLK